MQISGLSLDEFRAITDKVSAEHYEGNVIVHQDAHELSATRFVARLRVIDSRGEGARRSWTDRRTPSACWHAYRDVLAEMFAHYPDARVRTAMAGYRGRQGFDDNYPDTAYVNIGSQMCPVTMPELCDHGYGW